MFLNPFLLIVIDCLELQGRGFSKSFLSNESSAYDMIHVQICKRTNFCRERGLHKKKTLHFLIHLCIKWPPHSHQNDTYSHNHPAIKWNSDASVSTLFRHRFWVRVALQKFCMQTNINIHSESSLSKYFFLD